MVLNTEAEVNGASKNVSRSAFSQNSEISGNSLPVIGEDSPGRYQRERPCANLTGDKYRCAGPQTRRPGLPQGGRKDEKNSASTRAHPI